METLFELLFLGSSLGKISGITAWGIRLEKILGNCPGKLSRETLVGNYVGETTTRTAKRRHFQKVEDTTSRVQGKNQQRRQGTFPFRNDMMGFPTSKGCWLELSPLSLRYTQYYVIEIRCWESSTLGGTLNSSANGHPFLKCQL